MGQNTTVFIVVDDSSTLETVTTVVKSMDLPFEVFHSGEEFIRTYDGSRPGCLIVEACLGRMSGLELLERLSQSGNSLPPIVVSAFADTRATVRAMRLGAVTVLERPCKDFELFEAIREALAVDSRHRRERMRRRVVERRLSALSTTERQVLELMIAGEKNKNIASDLNVSLRTIEQRRRRIFQKMKAGSVPELVRMTMLVEPELLRQGSQDDDKNLLVPGGN